MNYSVTSIRIPSRWFDQPERKMNTFQKMGGYKGFYLYLQLYKFRIHNQENEHTFITSISMLRKETGYTTEEVFNLLKKLKGAKVINIAGVSRWEYLLDENGKPMEEKILLITVAELESYTILSDFDKTEDFYIWVSFDLLQQYEKAKLDEKHFALHCLVQRMQRGKDNVCFMGIETMAEVLGIDKDTINRMIFNMNRNYLMVSFRKVNKKRGNAGYKYEHITFEDNNKYANEKMNHWEGWLSRYKEAMDTITNRANSKAKSKKKQREKLKSQDVTLKQNKQKEVEEKQVDIVQGEPDLFDPYFDEDPFENVEEKHIHTPSNIDTFLDLANEGGNPKMIEINEDAELKKYQEQYGEDFGKQIYETHKNHKKLIEENRVIDISSIF